MNTISNDIIIIKNYERNYFDDDLVFVYNINFLNIEINLN